VKLKINKLRLKIIKPNETAKIRRLAVCYIYKNVLFHIPFATAHKPMDF